MTSRMQALLVLAALVLVPSLALAASAAPLAPAAPPAAAAALAPPMLAPATSTPACPAGGAPSLLGASTEAGTLCGACSDSACAGQAEFFTCGSGLRCLAQGTCSSGKARCACLII